MIRPWRKTIRKPSFRGASPSRFGEAWRSQSVVPATKSAHGGSQSAVPATKSALQESSENSNHNGGTDPTMIRPWRKTIRKPSFRGASPSRFGEAWRSQSVVPATKSAHGGSQSAVPATKSALQESSENSNHNGGTDPTMIRPWRKTIRKPSFRGASPSRFGEAWRSQSAVPATKSAHGGSQSAVPATKSALQESSENSNHNGGTDPTMIRPWRKTIRKPSFRGASPSRFGEAWRSQSVVPATKSAHGGSQSAVPATKSALQESSENSNHNGGTDPTMIRPWRKTIRKPSFRGASPSRFGEAWRSQSVVPATKSAHGGSQSAVPATKSALQESSENSNHNGGTDPTMIRPWRKTIRKPSFRGASPSRFGEAWRSQSVVPATKSAHGGSQSAVPATKSALQESSENSNHNGGTDPTMIRPWRKTIRKPSFRGASPSRFGEAWRSQSVVPATKSAHGGSQSAVPATKSALQESSENSNHNGGTDPTMIRPWRKTIRKPSFRGASPSRFGEAWRSQSVVPATKSAHGGSQSAVPATKSALQESSENSNTMEEPIRP